MLEVSCFLLMVAVELTLESPEMDCHADIGEEANKAVRMMIQQERPKSN